MILTLPSPSSSFLLPLALTLHSGDFFRRIDSQDSTHGNLKFLLFKDYVNPEFEPLMASMDSDIPPCVRFSPKDNELIRVFLEPWINNVAIDKCLITNVDIYTHHPDLLAHIPSGYFPQGEYWYFVLRTLKGASNKIKRTVGMGNKNGRWVHGRSTTISEGGVTIGHKQKLVFKDSQNMLTGWHQYEYSLHSPQLQQLNVVSHLIYKMEDDAVLAQALDIMEIDAQMEAPVENAILNANAENSFEAIMEDFGALLNPNNMEID
ncbi:unnamed protein product [Arabis nemorensis]|uniref:NAC domain-containing protein n=1 Tax=Arabis nemorensis TaxID=586526 RepID=A0A565AX31_9BRAS|nr:unnamed protein product [Arabis nemorensis]